MGAFGNGSGCDWRGNLAQNKMLQSSFRPANSQESESRGRVGFRLRSLRMGGKEKPSPRKAGRGRLQSQRILVVRVFTSRSRFVELAWRANCFLTGIRSHEPGRHVPVQVVDGVGVFGVRLGQFAGEDLRLLL